MLLLLITTLQKRLCLIDCKDILMNHYLDLLTHIPLNYSGHVYRSPMPFSRYDPSQRVWDGYLANKIRDVFVLAEVHEFPRVAAFDLLGFYRSQGLDVYHYPIPDFQVPKDRKALDVAIEALELRAQAGKPIAVHCLAGIGRTGLFLGCVGKRHLSLGGQQAVQWIREVIPGSLENLLQENYVSDF